MATINNDNDNGYFVLETHGVGFLLY